MTTFAALAVWMLGASQAPNESPVTVGAYRIEGRDVPATVPSAPGPLARTTNVLTLDGEKYLISQTGQFVRRFRADGGWSEVRQAMSLPPSAPPVEWRVKVFLLPRSQILDVGPNGLARSRVSQMEASEVAHVTESLARFAAMAESASQRRVSVRVDLENDPDPVPQIAEKGKPPFGAEFLRTYLQPRINGGAYEAEDRVYRGPYDSVFVIHAGFCGPGSTEVVHDTAVTPIAFYAQGRPMGPFALAGALFNGWVKHLEFAAQKAGYRFGANVDLGGLSSPGELAQGFGPLNDINKVFKGSMWGRVLGRAATPTEAFLGHGTFVETAPRSWSEVADDSFAKLPFLSSDQVAKLAGARTLAAVGNDRIAFQLDGNPDPRNGPPLALDSWLSPGQEACVRLATAQSTRSLLLVDASFAELMVRGLPAGSNPLAAGWLEIAGRRLLVIQADNLPDEIAEAGLVRLPGNPWTGAMPIVPMTAPLTQDPIAELTPNGSTAAAVPSAAAFQVSDAVDAERGQVLAIRVAGLVRTGSALLLGRRNGPTIFDPGQHPYLSFFVQATNPEPMNLRFAASGGTPDRVVRLFGRWPAPAEIGEDPYPEVSLPTIEGWRHVVIDLRKLNLPAVSAVWLESNEWASYWPSAQTEIPTILLDDLKVTIASPGPALELSPHRPLSGDSASGDPEARAFFAASADLTNDSNRAAVVALAEDPHELVQLNAVRALGKLKAEECEAALAKVLTTLNPLIAGAAAESLAKQDTPTAWAALKRAVEIGPFDFTRVYAARAMAQRKDPLLVATLSLMLTSPSWRGRGYAAQALGAIPGDRPQLVLMAFLHEIDPGARRAVTLAADVNNNEVCKRLLWSAVNDPSDELRALSCFRLIQSGKPNFVSEGLKGVRDDSVGMRRRLLELLRGTPIEAARPALRLAIADTSPLVRADALRTMAAWPDPVPRSEYESVLNDPDPRVQAALAELRKAQGTGVYLRN